VVFGLRLLTCGVLFRLPLCCLLLLAQMVKCEVVGERLELEFIVTGGAQFKVSAAALGLNTAAAAAAASSNAADTSSSNAAAGGGTAATITNTAVGSNAMSSSSSTAGRVSGRLDGEGGDLDIAAAADTGWAPSATAPKSATADSSGPGSSGRQQQQQDACTSNGHLQGGHAKALTRSSPGTLSSSLAGMDAALGARNSATAAAAADASSSSSQLNSMTPPRSPSAGGAASGQSATRDDGNAADPSAVGPLIPDATKAGSRTLARWITRYSSSSTSGGTAVQPVGSPPGASLTSQGLGGGLSQSSGKQSFVRSLGSRTLTLGGSSSEDAGARSSFRPVKTDDGEYVVWVEAFSLTFRWGGGLGGGVFGGGEGASVGVGWWWWWWWGSVLRVIVQSQQNRVKLIHREQRV
jgi:hypothetical protein